VSQNKAKTFASAGQNYNASLRHMPQNRDELLQVQLNTKVAKQIRQYI